MISVNWRSLNYMHNAHAIIHFFCAVTKLNSGNTLPALRPIHLSNKAPRSSEQGTFIHRWWTVPRPATIGPRCWPRGTGREAGRGRRRAPARAAGNSQLWHMPGPTFTKTIGKVSLVPSELATACGAVTPCEMSAGEFEFLGCSNARRGLAEDWQLARHARTEALSVAPL